MAEVLICFSFGHTFTDQNMTLPTTLRPWSICWCQATMWLLCLEDGDN